MAKNVLPRSDQLNRDVAAHLRLWLRLAVVAVTISVAVLRPLAIAKEIKLDRDDLTITAATTIMPGVYHVVDHNDDGALRIRGDHLIVDFQGATLRGDNDDALPDHFRGRGIVIEDSTDVVLKNAKIRGFKLAIYARNCRNLTIEGCDLSDNVRQHLLSTPQAENGADWLFGHENDQNEWLRYGAAIYLDGCTGFALHNNSAHRGQNGICLVRSNEGAVYDNDCSFNSGWGLALYRSCRNRIARNKLDWCIRGYSHGVYNRGQDSAGILVFEQCSENVFAFNSATHGGDGFFLFAGLETLDETGQGGSNGNLVYRNDFSHASNNGIEATFSRGNRFVENIMDEADHAIWAGYSYGTQFIGNKISHSNHGISIEHGSGNLIEGNTFDNCTVAINLWANDRAAFADKPYGRSHHCRSEGYTIVRNRFHDNRVDARLVKTTVTVLKQNDFDAPVALEISGRSTGIVIEGNNLSGKIHLAETADVSWKDNFFSQQPPSSATSADAPRIIDFARREDKVSVPDLPGKQEAFLRRGAPRGLKYIFIDEWGPYDFSRVKVVPERPVFWTSGELRALGPETPFVIKNLRGGIDVSPLSGKLPAVLTIAASDREMHEFSFLVELPQTAETIPVAGLVLSAEWDVKFYSWKLVGPQKPPADWSEVLAGPVLEERKLPRIDFAWGGGAPSGRVPADHFATVATSEMELPAGKYRVRTVSDDGIRVYVDGKRVIDNWSWHPPTENSAELQVEAGKHTFKIEHFEIDGVAQLQFWLTPVTLLKQ